MDDIGGCGIMKSICIKATGFRRIIVALLAIMICIMPYAVSSADGTPAFVDDAGLCSEDEVQEINTRLDGLCDKYNMKFAIVTVDDMGYKSPMVFSDDYYDEAKHGLRFTGGFIVLCCQDLSGQRCPAEFSYFSYRSFDKQ